MTKPNPHEKMMTPPMRFLNLVEQIFPGPGLSGHLNGAKTERLIHPGPRLQGGHVAVAQRHPRIREPLDRSLHPARNARPGKSRTIRFGEVSPPLLLNFWENPLFFPFFFLLCFFFFFYQLSMSLICGEFGGYRWSLRRTDGI